MPSGRGQQIQVPLWRRPLRREGVAESRWGACEVPTARPVRCTCQRSVDEALREVAVGVDPAVAQERPVRAAELDLRQVAVHDQDLFLVHRRALRRSGRRARRRTTGPRTRCRPCSPACPWRRGSLVADAVRRADVAAVGDGVAALDQFPRVVLRLAVLLLLRGCQPMAVG